MAAENWFNSDDYWLSNIPVLFHKDRMKNTGSEIEALLRLTKTKSPASVLDLCCGIGRHSIELARRGLQVTGVDITRPYLDIARQKANEEDVAIQFVEGDSRTYCQPDCFDLVINMFHSFGYFKEPSDDLKVLENAYRSLKPGGKIVIELVGKEMMAASFAEKSKHEYDEYTLFTENKVFQDWSWLEIKWTVVKGDWQKQYESANRLYSAGELKDHLREKGFRNVNAYGNFLGFPYTHKSKIMVITGEK
jgi:ubiquinone/menaquinone biosynthesis C-methylase UbiE